MPDRSFGPQNAVPSPPPTTRSLLLGVTGGIATGKTTVARMFEVLGARVIDFDQLSRIVVEPGKPAWKEVVAAFGGEILRADRTLDRKKLSDLVFQDEGKRRKLEEILHPPIYEAYRTRARKLTAEHPDGVIQAVVPLLIEAGLRSWFDQILLVYAPEEIQIRRLMARDQIGREQALRIIRCQMPIEEKKRHADFLIDNSGTLEETLRQVEAVWARLCKMEKTGGREGKTGGG